MKHLFVLVLAMTLSAYAGAADVTTCQGYMLMEKGVTLEYKDYDNKEKLEGIQEQTVTEILESGGVITVKIHSVFKDAKGKTEHEGDMTFTCKDGEIKVDMSSMMDPKMSESLKDMELKIEQTNLVFPSAFTEGQTLPDGQMTMTASSGGYQVMKIVTSIVERKVEKFESLTTEAGTFECVKLSEVVKTEMTLGKSQSKIITWITMGLGPVRTETYNEKGELQGVHVLSKVTR